VTIVIGKARLGERMIVLAKQISDILFFVVWICPVVMSIVILLLYKRNKVRLEEQLHESEKRFEAIVRALPDVVLIINDQGVFLDCEMGKNDWLLYTPEDFIGKNLKDLMPEHIAVTSIQKIKTAIELNTYQIYEYELDLPNGMSYYEARFSRLSDTTVITILRDVTELKKRQNDIEYMSYHDHLTDLYNRRFFEAELVRLDIERNYPLTLAVIDINGLKMVNDAFGHNEGDQLIRTIADIIKVECRADDIIARTGGDEFVMILPRTTEHDARKIMNHIEDIIDEKEISSYCLSIAIGYETKSIKSQVIQDVILKAEEKMYHNKISGSQLMRYNTIKAIIHQLNSTLSCEATHAQQCRKYGKILGDALGFDHESLKELEQLADVHDIGKIAIQHDILNKKGPLLVDEYEEVKRHSEIGYQILKTTDNYAPIAECVLYHHEFWDGKGYPKGLKGDEIPRLSRILSIVEAYDAMTSMRPYRDIMTHEEAIQELRSCSGKQFDPNYVTTFIQVINNSTFPVVKPP